MTFHILSTLKRKTKHFVKYTSRFLFYDKLLQALFLFECNKGDIKGNVSVVRIRGEKTRDQGKRRNKRGKKEEEGSDKKTCWFQENVFVVMCQVK